MAKSFLILFYKKKLMEYLRVMADILIRGQAVVMPADIWYECEKEIL